MSLEEHTLATEGLFAQANLDDWQNTVLGMGGTKDPSAYTTFGKRGYLDDLTLEALYIEDHFAAKVVEALPKHALRAGWDILVPGDPKEAAKVREAYAEAERRLEVAEELSQGACWGRLFGGAVTFVGAEDGRPSGAELDETAIKSIRFLQTYDRRDVFVWSYYQDPTHPKFRQPESFLVRPIVVRGRGGLSAALNTNAPYGGGAGWGWTGTLGAGFIVHESRCLVWRGSATTDQRRVERDGWDDSVLERAWVALKQLAEDYAAKSLLLNRISQSVYRIKNLYKLLAGKERETLETRMKLLDESRSRARAILLDLEEEFINVTQPLAGTPEMLDKAILRLAAAADMPATILMGQSPAGFDATGDNDLEVWAGEAESWQGLILRPRHARLAKLIMLAKNGPTSGKLPDEWSIAYRPVRRPKPKEEAEVAKLIAETDASNIDKGVYPAEAAAFRYGPQGAGHVVLDAVELEERLERRRELAMQPPKDNAELGTIGPRTQAVMDVIAAVAEGRISRESGIAVLVEIHRHTEDVAKKLLGSAGLADPVPAPAPSPGPSPEPQPGAGAGAPPAV